MTKVMKPHMCALVLLFTVHVLHTEDLTAASSMNTTETYNNSSSGNVTCGEDQEYCEDTQSCSQKNRQCNGCSFDKVKCPDGRCVWDFIYNIRGCKRCYQILLYECPNGKCYDDMYMYYSTYMYICLNVLNHKPHVLMGCAQNVDKTVHRVQKAKNGVLIKTAYLRASYVQSRASTDRYTVKMSECVVTITRTVNVIQATLLEVMGNVNMCMKNHLLTTQMIMLMMKHQMMSLT